jgi:hypothetical protein
MQHDGPFSPWPRKKGWWVLFLQMPIHTIPASTPYPGWTCISPHRCGLPVQLLTFVQLCSFLIHSEIKSSSPLYPLIPIWPDTTPSLCSQHLTIPALPLAQSCAPAFLLACDHTLHSLLSQAFHPSLHDYILNSPTRPSLNSSKTSTQAVPLSEQGQHTRGTGPGGSSSRTTRTNATRFTILE